MSSHSWKLANLYRVPCFLRTPCRLCGVDTRREKYFKFTQGFVALGATWHSQRRLPASGPHPVPCSPVCSRGRCWPGVASPCLHQPFSISLGPRRPPGIPVGHRRREPVRGQGPSLGLKGGALRALPRWPVAPFPSVRSHEDRSLLVKTQGDVSSPLLRGVDDRTVLGVGRFPWFLSLTGVSLPSLCQRRASARCRGWSVAPRGPVSAPFSGATGSFIVPAGRMRTSVVSGGVHAARGWGRGARGCHDQHLMVGPMSCTSAHSVMSPYLEPWVNPNFQRRR